MNSWFRGSTRAVIAGFALLLPLAFAAVASAVMPCVLVPSGPMTLTLAADCTTDTTILIPNGFTLDGAGHTITAVDPSGDHFKGAVVANGGATAQVREHLRVVLVREASEVCGARRVRSLCRFHDG